MFRVIAFLVGLISLVTGVLKYDSELSTAPLPIVSGLLVMLIAVFNLMPKIRRCTACNKMIPTKSETCRFCKVKQ